MSKIRSLCAAGFVLLAGPAFAQTEDTPVQPTTPPAPVTSASLTLTLESTGNVERNTVTYQCDTGQPLTVQYLNAAPNFLAIVPVDGVNHVFATAISGSGARYLSGPYEWWSHQGEGTLRDLMQDEDAEPLATCNEIGSAP